MQPSGTDYDIDEREPPADECDRAWTTLDDERQPFDSDNDIAFGAPHHANAQQRELESRF